MSSGSIFLITLLLFNLFSSSGTAQDKPTALQIFISEGDGAINTVRQKPTRDPIVVVEDQEHRPIVGAAVVFFLPNQGTGGTFSNGNTTLTVTTNAEGQAVARGMQFNAQPGPMQIRVTASYMGLTANSVINQTNIVGAGSPSTASSGGSSSKKWLIILAIAGGAAAGGAAALSGGKSTGSTSGGGAATAVTLTPGAVTVGAPQ